MAAAHCAAAWSRRQGVCRLLSVQCQQPLPLAVQLGFALLQALVAVAPESLAQAGPQQPAAAAPPEPLPTPHQQPAVRCRAALQLLPLRLPPTTPPRPLEPL